MRDTPKLLNLRQEADLFPLMDSTEICETRTKPPAAKLFHLIRAAFWNSLNSGNGYHFSTGGEVLLSEPEA